MTEKVFVDTNVLIYRLGSRDPDKQSRAENWFKKVWENRIGRVSFQVLQEFYVNVTSKLEPGLDPPKSQTVPIYFPKIFNTDRHLTRLKS